MKEISKVQEMVKGASLYRIIWKVKGKDKKISYG